MRKISYDDLKKIAICNNPSVAMGIYKKYKIEGVEIAELRGCTNYNLWFRDKQKCINKLKELGWKIVEV